MSKVQLHACILIVLLGAAIAAAKSAKPLMVEGRPRTDFSGIPLDLGEWYGRNSKFGAESYKALPSCSLLLRYYEHYEHPFVELAVVYGTDLGDFHQPEACLEGQGLCSVKKGKVRISEGEGVSFEAVSLIMESAYDRRAFVFWFSDEGKASTFLGSHKARVFLKRLRARKIEPSALVRLSTQVLGSDEEAVNRLVRFAEDVVPYLKKEFAAGTSKTSEE